MFTKTIANQTITLTEGRRYYASRPAATRGITIYPVTIRPLGHSGESVTIPDLDYDQANEFINSFNNEEWSFSGRIW